MHNDRYSELFADDAELKDHRYVLQSQYLDLTQVELPALAKSNGWLIKHDHCFMRIILDQLFNDCWYNHLDRRLRAYKQLNNQQLKTAISLGRAIADQGEAILNIWNRQSLQWRNKA
ncbi:MAG: hypothetical protein AAF939_16655 [Planctomycetota bacterium]